MKLHHVGFEVEDLDAAIAVYEELGFAMSKRFEKPEPKAHVASMKDAAGMGIELWQFLEEHPQRRYIAHHTAFMCDDVRQSARELEKAGFTEVIPFTEGVIFDYIFVQDITGNTYELAQEKPS